MSMHHKARSGTQSISDIVFVILRLFSGSSGILETHVVWLKGILRAVCSDLFAEVEASESAGYPPTPDLPAAPAHFFLSFS